MPIDLTLRCDHCDAAERPRKVFSLRAGLLSLKYVSSFYVDGGAVRCPTHTTAAQKSNMHRQMESQARSDEFVALCQEAYDRGDIEIRRREAAEVVPRDRR